LADDGLDTQGSPFFEVLLDTRMLVGEVQLHLGSRTEQSGAERFLGGLAHLAGEDHRHLGGPSDANVVGHERLEEAAGASGVVEDDGAADFDLAHGQLPPVAGSAISLGQRGGDAVDPTVEEAVHLRRVQPVTDGLQPGRRAAGGEPVGQLAEGDPRLEG
jgi:hypothetical protein